MSEVPYERVPCPLCAGERSSEPYRTEKWTGSSLGRVAVRLARCEDCGFVFNSPRPTAEAMERYYAEDSFASGGVFRERHGAAYYPKLFAERAEFYAPFLARRPAGMLLDVGCGQGGFLRALRNAGALGNGGDGGEAGWELCGLEPSKTAGKEAAADGFAVTRGYLGEPLFADASFDAVSLISVLEHLPRPLEAMREVARLLKPGGIVLLEVPNSLHPELSLTGNFGLEHVCHFTPATLRRLLDEVGLGEMRQDDRVRDHGLRLVAGSDLAAWGVDDPETPPDDGKAFERAIALYATREAELLLGLELRVQAALERWRSEGRRIAIYGAGAHTAELATRFDLAGHASFVIDGDARKQGSSFLGLPVGGPESITENGIEAVLLSSHRFVDEMAENVRRHGGPDVALERCYDDAGDTVLR